MVVVEELPGSDSGVLLDVSARGGYLQRCQPARFHFSQ